jgi:predicted nucleic acid-binding protein
VSLLLDTNVLSELRKGARANARVREWFAGVADDEIHLSVLVVGELRRGIERIRRRDARQAVALERWLGRVVREHAPRILAVDGRVAEEWGRLTAERPGSLVDTLMAATARVHGLVLVTRNTRDVAWTGVPHLNPFEAAPLQP